MVYRPFDNYWEATPKILVCNLETYGYDESGVTNVTLEQLKDWMWDTHITKTTRYTSVFISALQQSLGGNSLTAKEIKDSYHDYDNLVIAMSKICYMNFRKQSNPNVTQDINAILTEADKYKEFLEKFILTCNPDIMIVSGKTGVTCFNEIFNSSEPLSFDSETIHQGIRVISTRHLSRIKYSYLENKILKISSSHIHA
jgi:hypothetical protein